MPANDVVHRIFDQRLDGGVHSDRNLPEHFPLGACHPNHDWYLVVRLRSFGRLRLKLRFWLVCLHERGRLFLQGQTRERRAFRFRRHVQAPFKWVWISDHSAAISSAALPSGSYSPTVDPLMIA